MMEPIRFENAECIVEYGPGTGSFTRELLKRKRPDTKLVLIEQNDTFCKLIRRQCAGQPNVTVIHGSAEHADVLLRRRGIKRVDYVVSGLPFTSLPKEVSVRIFLATRRILGKQGRFITFQYTLVKQRFFRKYFHFTDRLFELRNLPPAYVFVLRR
ncbi:MAG: methyltransferase domain-containing protein [Lachnospiraceae bacterium]|nr:methyltransferase domain-containing protein [Lachnospiraceae bacterium]